MNFLGQKLKDLRHKNNLTQEQLGSAVGISATMIRLIEKNQRKPSLKLLNLLSEYFNVPTSFLLDDQITFADDTQKNLNSFSEKLTQAYSKHNYNELILKIVFDFYSKYRGITDEKDVSNALAMDLYKPQITESIFKTLIDNKLIPDSKNIPENLEAEIAELIETQLNTILNSYKI